MKFKHRKNYNIPNQAHELTFSCYHNYSFLKSERTCHWLAQAINKARVKHDFLLWAYVFMPNHAHIIVYPSQREYDIAKIRRAIKSPVASKAIRHCKMFAPQWIPKMTRQRGKQTEVLFWQSGGGYDRNITESKTLLSMIDYIHLNPVRKNLIEFTKDWKWSSAAWYANSAECPIPLDRIPKGWLQ